MRLAWLSPWLMLAETNCAENIGLFRSAFTYYICERHPCAPRTLILLTYHIKFITKQHRSLQTLFWSRFRYIYSSFYAANWLEHSMMAVQLHLEFNSSISQVCIRFIWVHFSSMVKFCRYIEDMIENIFMISVSSIYSRNSGRKVI